MTSPKEIKIRNIDPAALAKLEHLAIQAGLSRNQYLKKYLESLSVLNDLREIDERYSSLVKLVNEVIEKNTLVLNQLLQMIEADYGE